MTTRRALVFSFLDRYAALVMSIVSSMIIARLLTPEELGVFSVVMVLIMLISALRDLGAGQYLVQETELTPVRIRATWTVLLGTGCVMSAIVAIAAIPVSEFYDEPRMKAVMWVIALNFLVNPFGSMTYAWLMRQMRFDALAVMRFGSSLTGAVVSVWLAWLDWGPMSLAVGSLSSTLVNALLALRFRPPEFGWRLSVQDIGRVVRYGSQISGSSVLSSIGNGAPEVLLGKMQSLAAAGLYSRSNGLAQMFQRLVIDATQAVAMPLFSQARRDFSPLAPPFLRAFAYVTALGWSFFAGMAMLSHPLTRVLYGNQWDASVPLTRLLAIAMMFQVLAALCPAALMGTGQSGRMLRITAVVVVIYVGAVASGVSFGLTGVGIAIVFAHAVCAPVWLIGAKPAISFTWTGLLKTAANSAAVAGLASLGPAAVVLGFGLEPQRPILALVLAAASGVLLFVLAVKLLHHPLRDEAPRISAGFVAAFRRLRRGPA